MTHFPLLCGAVAAVLHPLPSQAGTGADGWRLDCRGGLEAPVCRALAETLALRVGTVYLAGDAPEGTPTLRFVIEAQGPEAISGHLAWQRPDGRTGRDPALTLSVSDAELTEPLLRRFAAELLRLSRATF